MSWQKKLFIASCMIAFPFYAILLVYGLDWNPWMIPVFTTISGGLLGLL